MCLCSVRARLVHCLSRATQQPPPPASYLPHNPARLYISWAGRQHAEGLGSRTFEISPRNNFSHDINFGGKSVLIPLRARADLRMKYSPQTPKIHRLKAFGHVQTPRHARNPSPYPLLTSMYSIRPHIKEDLTSSSKFGLGRSKICTTLKASVYRIRS